MKIDKILLCSYDCDHFRFKQRSGTVVKFNGKLGDVVGQSYCTKHRKVLTRIYGGTDTTYPFVKCGGTVQYNDQQDLLPKEITSFDTYSFKRLDRESGKWEYYMYETKTWSRRFTNSCIILSPHDSYMIKKILETESPTAIICKSSHSPDRIKTQSFKNV